VRAEEQRRQLQEVAPEAGVDVGFAVREEPAQELA
jgi:hypothetical protein